MHPWLEQARAADPSSCHQERSYQPETCTHFIHTTYLLVIGYQLIGVFLICGVRGKIKLF